MTQPIADPIVETKNSLEELRSFKTLKVFEHNWDAYDEERYRRNEQELLDRLTKLTKNPPMGEGTLYLVFSAFKALQSSVVDLHNSIINSKQVIETKNTNVSIMIAMCSTMCVIQFVLLLFLIITL